MLAKLAVLTFLQFLTIEHFKEYPPSIASCEAILKWLDEIMELVVDEDAKTFNSLIINNFMKQRQNNYSPLKIIDKVAGSTLNSLTISMNLRFFLL